MANFDAMVPLIPRDARIPIDQDREQLRVNQVEKTKEVAKISDEESNTITDNDARRQPGKQGSQQQQNAPQEDADGDNDGHIDTYA